MKGNITFSAHPDLLKDIFTTNEAFEPLEENFNILEENFNNLTLNNISGTLSLTKGGTSSSNQDSAFVNLLPKVATSQSSITTGSRNDGSITIYKYGRLVNFECRLITGGKTQLNSGYVIPSGYRPSHQVRFPVTLHASNNITGYGYMLVDTSGSIYLCLSTSGDAEINASAWWMTAY